MNCLSIPTLILSYMIQNTVNVICIMNTRHKKCKDNMKEIHIYRYKDSCIGNEEVAI